MGTEAAGSVTTLLFTDIEGSSRLWERERERMPGALAGHDDLARATVALHRGQVVKMLGDGLHAAFADPLDAVLTAADLQRQLRDSTRTNGIALRVRCGMHLGVVEPRDGDYFGTAVNRAARIVAAAHGGQVLLSRAIADTVAERLPAGLALRDLGTVRLRDLALPEHLYQLDDRDLPAEFPPLRSLDATPNNLPQQVTSFVGRDADAADVRRLLAGCRLLTLHGPGGIGKTRLALQVAADLLDTWPDGAWFVALDAIDDGARVLPAVAQALGVRGNATTPLLEAVAAHVAARRLLLVVDNCEHVLDACAACVDALLRSAATLTVIATSREPLRVPAEQAYPVPALSLPASEAPIVADELAQFAALRLFVDRARQQRPDFAATDANIGAITEICRRLDGIPLAIELAAARTRVLPVEAIAARLDDRFRLLTSGSRSALPRQQTLRALIDWSYDLLDATERTFFARVAVFAGGCTVDAAEAVCAGDGVAREHVFDLLASLTDKSLVVFEASDAAGRYRTLATIREFAQEKLDASPGGQAVRDRHLALFLALAEDAERHFWTADQGDWFERLDREHENLLAAHACCGRSPGGAIQGLRLVSALRSYWVHRGKFHLGAQLVAEARARASGTAGTLPWARAQFAAGQFAFFAGRYADARERLADALANARGAGDRPTVVMALTWLGHVLGAQGEAAGARAHLEQALAAARDLRDPARIATALNGLAEFHRAAGDAAAAQPLYEEGLALYRMLGSRTNCANGLTNLAAVTIARGHFDPAQDMLREAVALVIAIGSRSQGQFALDVVAGLAMARRRWEVGVRLLGASEAQLTGMGLQREPPDERFIAPLVRQARAVLGDERHAALLAAGAALDYPDALAAAQAWLAPDAGNLSTVSTAGKRVPDA